MSYMDDLLQQRQQFGDPYAQPPSSLDSIVGALPPSPYGQAAASNPGLVNDAAGMVGRLTDPQQQPMFPSGAFDDSSGVTKLTRPATFLPAEPAGGGDNSYGRPSAFNQTAQGQPNDAMGVVDDIKAVIGLPFGLLNAGRNAIQDTLNLPGAQQRQRSEAMVQALQNLTPYQKQVMGLPADFGIQTASQQGGTGIATGSASSLGQGTAQSSQPGFFQWAKNLGRDQNQQQLNQIRGALQANFMAGKMTEQAAKAAAEIARIALTKSQTEGQDYKNQLDYRYGDRQELGTATEREARTAAGYAQAGESGARTGLANTQNANAQQKGEQDRLYFDQIKMPTGQERLSNYQAMDPLKRAQVQAQTDNTRSITTQRDAKLNDPAVGQKSALAAVRAYNTAKGSAAKDAIIAASGLPTRPATGLGASIQGLFGGDPGTELDLGALADRIASPPVRSVQAPSAAPPGDLGSEASTQAATIPGQAPVDANGEVAAAIRDYATPKGIDAAYQAGHLSERVARAALELLGYQRGR